MPEDLPIAGGSDFLPPTEEPIINNCIIGGSIGSFIDSLIGISLCDSSGDDSTDGENIVEPPQNQAPQLPEDGEETSDECLSNNLIGGWFGGLIDNIICIYFPPNTPDDPIGEVVRVGDEGSQTGDSGDQPSFNIGGSGGGGTGSGSGSGGGGSTGWGTGSGDGSSSGGGSGSTDGGTDSGDKDSGTDTGIEEDLKDSLNDSEELSDVEPPQYDDSDPLDPQEFSQGYFDCPALVAFDTCYRGCGDKSNSTNCGDINNFTCWKQRSDEYDSCTTSCRNNYGDADGKPPYCEAY